MKTGLSIFLDLFLPCYLLTVNLAHAEQSLTQLKKPMLAPAFKLNDLDGIPHPLSEYRGKPVIVNFWATWCPPCREELPSMNRAWDIIKNEGIIMLAINVAEDEDTIFKFLGDYPINFTLLLDQNAETAGQWPMKGLPTTYVVNPHGYIVYRAVGGRDWDDKKLLDMVRNLKKQH
ncbi:Thiol:disulfide oxidoreductase related to ResA [hydrothermal vent metagenome]|uniref:Thiol:disulfide oxidoreductase related to ResA n=1 Tax=hydrothermal vent metagenome TaxID=652676 RepID=A0A3B0XZM3_9ZZZZ